MDKRVKYILLEDEPISSLAMRTTLSDLRPHWSLLAASDIAADIPALISLDPDLILSDIFLCDGAVFDFFEQLSCIIPLILLSGYPHHPRPNPKNTNLIAFIEKPVSRSELEEILLLAEKTISLC